jgi:hypothetical protein
MLRFYTPILLLQIFCLYHAYKGNTQQKWYWLIIFFPFFGSLLYLFDTFYNKDNIRNLAEGVKGVMNSNYRIAQLEKALKFSDNVTNKVNLADAYMSAERYQDAIPLYTGCLQGFMSEDVHLRMKLLRAYFFSKDYDAAIALGQELETEKSFKNTEERVIYAWALHFQEQTNLAWKVFNDMDKSFTNYKHRAEYCKFLMATNRAEDSKNKLAELIEEFNHMRDGERRLNKPVIREIRELYDNALRKS